MSTISKKFFTKNGKVLKGVKFSLKPIETLIGADKTSSFTKEIPQKRVKLFIKNVKERLLTAKRTNVSSRITTAWASVSAIAIFITLTAIMITPGKAKPQDPKKYTIYSSKPLVLEQSTYNIYSKDSRAQRINEVFKAYNCPLEGMGESFVFEADRNNIPWWLVASVSFQESSCGKNTPKVGGAESYNAWGWAVYGDITWSFDNWARGIETVSRYFGNRFYSQGVTDLCEIMKTYTPPSDGSWCKGVQHFADIIQSYETL